MYYYALQRKWFLPTDMAEKDRCDHPRTLPNPTLFKRHVETGNHGVSCFHHLRPIGLPLNPMKCGIGLYASYGMESNRKADRRRDKLPSGEGRGCEEIKAIAM